MNPFNQDMVKMKLPAGMGSNLSIAGFSLDADEDGCVTVPKQHVDGLKSHGLSIYSAPEKKAK